MEVPNFTVFDTSSGTNQGLVKLTLWQRIIYFFKERAFKRVIENPDQPSFFISKANWDTLFDQQKSIGDVKYEVYGFVFCIAFTTDDDYRHEKKDPRSCINKTKVAYFRVRTIWKKEGDSSTNPTVEVETKNIAFADISYARDPLEEGHLHFLLAGDSMINVIDSEVIIHYTPGNPVPENTPLIPNALKDRCGSIITNEGNMFSQKRIKSILGRHKGSKVSLIWNKSSKSISFKFKINPAYGTELPCPYPPVCG